MPVTHEYLADEGFVLFTLTDEIELEGLIQEVNAFRASPGYDPICNAVVDITAADLSAMSAEKWEQLADFLTSVSVDTPYKQGYVTGSKNINIIPFRLFAAYLEMSGGAFVQRFFITREDCMEWLAAPWTDEELASVSSPRNSNC